MKQNHKDQVVYCVSVCAENAAGTRLQRAAEGAPACPETETTGTEDGHFN